MNVASKCFFGAAFFPFFLVSAVGQTSPVKPLDPLAAAAAFATAHSVKDQTIDLLRFAAEEMGRVDSAESPIMDLLLIAQDQAIIQDGKGFAATVALIEREFAKADGMTAKRYAATLWPALAGAYAWAGDMEKAKATAAKVVKESNPVDVATMRGQMKDMAGLDAVLAPLKPDERQRAYGVVATRLWLGDHALAESLLKKAVQLAGDRPSSVSLYYARIGDMKTAAAFAQKDKNQYAWTAISESMEDLQEFELAKLAKTGYLTLKLQNRLAGDDSDLNQIFDYQIELSTPEVAHGTAERMVKSAIDTITKNDFDWEYQSTDSAEAGEAAARVGDEALVKSLLNATLKIKAPADKVKESRAQIDDWTTTGKARRLLADGKVKEAIALVTTIEDSTWKDSAFAEIFHDAMRRDDIEKAMAIYDDVDEASTREMNMLDWLARSLANKKMQGKPVNGKLVDVFEWIGLLGERTERAQGCRVFAEQLMRRGAVK